MINQSQEEVVHRTNRLVQTYKRKSGVTIDIKIARADGALCAERNERNAARACARDGRVVSVLKSDANT